MKKVFIYFLLWISSSYGQSDSFSNNNGYELKKEEKNSNSNNESDNSGWKNYDPQYQ
jgi:hypothetical protein